MSEQIDWSKAPEGATHYWPCHGSFYTKIGDKFYFAENIEVGRVNSPASWVKSLIPRPSQPWSGEGLPPVGVKVLIMNPEQFAITDYGQEFVGEECTVRAAFVNDLDYRMVAVEKVGGACCCFLSEMCFPIRTPEQIAADEREAAVDEMHKLYMEGAKHSGGLYALYDAGYRKQ